MYAILGDNLDTFTWRTNSWFDNMTFFVVTRYDPDGTSKNRIIQGKNTNSVIGHNAGQSGLCRTANAWINGRNNHDNNWVIMAATLDYYFLHFTHESAFIIKLSLFKNNSKKCFLFHFK